MNKIKVYVVTTVVYRVIQSFTNICYSLVVRASVDTLQDILDKSEKLNAKSGPFSCVVIIGNVLNDTKFTPKSDITIPTYVTNGDRFLGEENGSIDVVENLTLLNEYGIYELTNGFRIGYVTTSKENMSSKKDEVLEKFSKVSGIDMLVTNFWSTAISNNKKLLLGNTLIDEVVNFAKPRYHFSSSASKFFEMDPFKWDDAGSIIISRFINLAAFGSGQKWAYAFSIDIGAYEETQIPENIVGNPYLTTNNKRSAELRKVAPVKKLKVILPNSCHFCLSNPHVQEHMIISVSSYAYTTIAKGPLTIPRGEMGFSGHCLIIPIDHIPKLNNGDSCNDVLESPIAKDILKFESSIVSMNYNNYDMCTLVSEINSANSIHFHKQVIPVPKYLVAKFKTALNRQLNINTERYTNNAKFKFQEFTGFENEKYRALVNDPSTNYIQFTLYETPKAPIKVFIATFSPEERIDLQFGRRVAAFLLKLPKRVKWDSKICQQTKAQEEEETEKFQLAFKNFDFTN
ncbi:Drn1p Ecym_4447 [Eremothecium cymbalariae DBVPG|uniref:Cwf19-like C-terminal domain-containing protein n=1 Tax=Eremothecium cymbalariae (strain CBS 270.75 / DBVPG 7215 / KCTC 17166 / NRRL Y-17582) TaxID=931890 RepID=G8JTY9_ERECY|nr:hypothetical protein Ecym_4447 [Eremothecium cymbalariae DBVPG\